MAIADKHGLPVLEDCARYSGGTFKGKSVGTFGRMGMFSFQINKNATAAVVGRIAARGFAKESRLRLRRDKQEYAP